MPNTNGTWGLRPLSMLGSAPNSMGLTEYEIAVANTNALFQGELVIPLGTGFIDEPQAATGGTVSFLGVFWGCQYVSLVTGQTIMANTWPGSGADTNFPVKAFVYDNPIQLFVIATDATWTSEATARAHIFSNAALINADAGVTATGMSTCTLDTTTPATTNTFALRIMGWVDDPSNLDFTAAGIGVIVRINNHFHAPTGSIAAGTVSTTGA